MSGQARGSAAAAAALVVGWGSAALQDVCTLLVRTPPTLFFRMTAVPGLTLAVLVMLRGSYAQYCSAGVEPLPLPV